MLTSEQKEQFLTDGFTVIHNAFPREESLQWVREECAAVGYDLEDPTTWREAYARVKTKRVEPVPDFAPAAWEAACDLMGGLDRVEWQGIISQFNVNFSQGADMPYQKASANVGGWHKDGYHFLHFLDSYEQGLLGITLMTDALPEGGGTFIACDSVGAVARYLAARPEGVLPTAFDLKAILAECSDFREVTGNAGDFFLLHPFMLHAVSQNRLRRPRAIHNVLFTTKAPMNFNRPNPDDYSPVELAVLRGLGVDRYDFKPTEERFRSKRGQLFPDEYEEYLQSRNSSPSTMSARTQ